jgi:hypothetical protein
MSFIGRKEKIYAFENIARTIGAAGRIGLQYFRLFA